MKFDLTENYFMIQKKDGKTVPYNKKYYSRYKKYSKTLRGKEISRYRAEVVSLATKEKDYPLILDFGCAVPTTAEKISKILDVPVWVYDVNPYAEKDARKSIFVKWIDFPFGHKFDCVCLFDVYEHLFNPELIFEWLPFCECFVISIPIFKSVKDLQLLAKSRHFKPDEHYLYFTHEGILWYMQSKGYTCTYTGAGEIDAGREDIYTYIFKRDDGYTL